MLAFGGPVRPLVPGASKIAVLRANALGDFIFSIPALQSLRVAYPESEIVLLGTRLHASLLAGRPSPVDRVEVLPVVPGLVTAGEGHDVAGFLARMRGERFDLAIQVHGGGRVSNEFARSLGARVTAGLRTPDAAELDRWLPYVYYQHEVIRYLEVVGLVGARPVTYQPVLPVTRADMADAAAVMPPAPYAVLHPGASDPLRRWPAQSFAVVAARLSARGLRVVISGIGSERELVEEVALLSRVRDPVLAVDAVGVGGLAALMARASVVVSNDTGPLHLADAVGGRTVGVFWCGNMVNGAPLNRARHRPFPSWQRECPVCGVDCTRETCEHTESFVSDVGPDEVASAAEELAEEGWASEDPKAQPA